MTAQGWKTTTLNCEAEVVDLLADLRGKRWLSRGHPKPYDVLIPTLDRGSRASLSRRQKLVLERQSIDRFRSTARFFSSPGEQRALSDDFTVLMVLRHYDVPTRLLDWSRSPHVAAYWATCDNDSEDGELWSFDEPQYEIVGKAQWKRWPQTTSDRSGDAEKFEAGLTAFLTDEPPDWFCCGFYEGFPRQNAQEGAYSLMARFSRDHATAIAELLKESSGCHRYLIKAALKPGLRTLLRDRHGIWRGALFPDSAGAARTAGIVFDGA